MGTLQVFDNPIFGTVRTLEEDGQILFCGKDVCTALGYANPSKAMGDHCKGVTKRYTPTSGGEQEMTFIPESDLYRLVFGSKLPNAEKFTDWVTDEVLPTIRKHGAYMTPETLQAAILNPDTMIQLCQQLKEEQEKRKALEAERELNRPKVLFADAVTSADNSILVGEMAKLLRQNGVKIGQNRLFSWMRDNGYLIKRKGTDHNMPTQRSMEMGLFEIKEVAITRVDGVSVAKTPKVTGKGQAYFTKCFLQEVGA